MGQHIDHDNERERRTLRKTSDLFLQRLQAEWKRVERNRRKREAYHAGYNGNDDFAKSIDEAYRVIRARVTAGGKGWTPP